MLFSLEPKTNTKDLFDREKELEKISDAVEKDRIIVLDGLRRIGKTSVLKSFLNSSKHFNIFIDCRKFMKGSTINTYEFDKGVARSIQNEIKNSAFQKLIFTISSVNIKGIELTFKDRKKDLSSILSDINDSLENKNRKFIVAFDEAQYLRFYGRGGKKFLYLMAYAYDNLKNIVFVLTGSEIGVLFDFLKLEDPDEPLYARYTTEISLSRFTRDQSFEFLRKGLKEIGVKPSENDLSRVVEELDGIVGYLSMFGYEIYRNGPDFKSALEKTNRVAAALVKKEIDALIQKSSNYAYVLNAIALKMNRYSLIKKYVEAKYRKIYDSTLSNILDALVKQSFVEIEYKKSAKIYYIADPIVEKFCLSM